MLDMPNIQAANTERIEEIKAKFPPHPANEASKSVRAELSETDKVQFYLSKFTSYRHKYFDEIPKNILKPGDPHYEYYKCRGAWWTIISGNIQNARDNGLFKNTHIAQEVQKFLDYVKAVQTRRSAQMKNELAYRYTREDINGANIFLDNFIAYLSRRAVELGAEQPPPARA
ncbi:MAG: hypothetical protein HY981_01610 [Candidatus Magasanikbacteria bacterium]|nr:hypothetical protein [Candidatus Magasanikbacteria bacterium]